jgi:hypothetical protein
VKKLQEPEAADDVYLSREASYHYDDDGSLVLKARIPADAGELIVKALEMAMESHFVEAAPVGARPAGDNNKEEERIPIAARRADALCEIAETYLGHPENTGSTADRYQVVIHTNKDANHESHLENGPHVSAETSKRIACDCCKTEIEDDEYGNPLNIGRRSRTIPPPMRRALVSRDGVCRFPGCGKHRFCDGHHVKHWADGGETSLDNLVLLCRHHHHLVHEGGFDCRKGKGGEIYFIDRREERLADYAEVQPVSIEATLNWMHRRFADKDVSAETCKAQWYAGERMDMEEAVGMLWQASG